MMVNEKPIATPQTIASSRRPRWRWHRRQAFAPTGGGLRRRLAMPAKVRMALIRSAIALPSESGGRSS
jgi:hypothetical protein